MQLVSIWLLLSMPPNFFFYLGFLSQTFTIHRTAGEGGLYPFNSRLPPSPVSQTLRHQPGRLMQTRNQEPVLVFSSSISPESTEPSEAQENKSDIQLILTIFSKKKVYNFFSGHFLENINAMFTRQSLWQPGITVTQFFDKKKKKIDHYRVKKINSVVVRTQKCIMYIRSIFQQKIT